jgi:hypothetical protein
LSIQYGYRQFTLNKFDLQIAKTKQHRSIGKLEEILGRKSAFLKNCEASYNPKELVKYCPEFAAIDKVNLKDQRDWLMESIIHFADNLWELEDADDELVADIKWSEDTFTELSSTVVVNGKSIKVVEIPAPAPIENPAALESPPENPTVDIENPSKLDSESSIPLTETNIAEEEKTNEVDVANMALNKATSKTFKFSPMKKSNSQDDPAVTALPFPV